MLGADHPSVALSLSNLAKVYELQGKFAEAEGLDERALAIQQKALGANHPDVAKILDNLAHALLGQGSAAAARAQFEASLEIRDRFGDLRGMTSALEGLGLLALREGDISVAKTYFRRSLELCRNLDADEGLIWAIEGLARAAAAESRFEWAAWLLGAAQAAREQHDIPLPPPELNEYQQLYDLLKQYRLTA